LVYPAYYNGPVSYFARLIREKEIILEQYENYTKQTFRNRCMIMGPNGILSLVIPVLRNKGEKTLMKDVRIEYDAPWNKIHWKSLVAAYAASPYFELMKDDLFPCYNRQFRYLIDLNFSLIDIVLQLLGRKIPVVLSASFKVPEKNDPGSLIHPKKNPRIHDLAFRPVRYHQVFADRQGFQSNLSILDLLFNEGPGAQGILEESL
jgi:hypothetical protein